ncbi:ATP-dependent DNA helicase RecG [Roseiterribacter gracilis]|uniref:ATP-dependent DNA helicase RecG n=1 Tax=Roseiterribacter gracilis TaxID=2812848 RepID=UPI003B434ED2
MKRPAGLEAIFQPVTLVTGVGSAAAKALTRLAGPNLIDLLWHLPAGLVDRRYNPTVASAEPGRIATMTLEIGEHLPSRRPGMPYRVRAGDDTGGLHLVFFQSRAPWLQKLLPVDSTRIIAGKIEAFNGQKQIVHPDLVLDPAEKHRLKPIQTVYPLTAGINGPQLERWIDEAVRRAPDLPEWIDPPLLKREAWPSWRDAITHIHAPEDEDDLSPLTPWRRRLAFDELLANQLALLLVRERQRRATGRSTKATGALRAQALKLLPYKLTGAQLRTLGEIDADMAATTRMSRLLQGDVGSGKTIVAFLAMLSAVEAGRQAALMAPTEILARQHLQTIAPLALKLGLEVAVLTGRDKGKARARTLQGLAEGAIKLVVGTHALTQDPVEFRDLALTVVDEQHRFGVEDRMRLSNKGKGSDVLVMTATPIPRTLTLTSYGDLDVSKLDEKPPGRQPVDTLTLPADRLDEVVAGVGRAIAAGARVYWVCPLVEESEVSDLAAARERAAELSAYFKGRVGLVHGRLRGPEKDAVMAQFAKGEIDILVATTVIEVGVNVPEATVMVIEHAERFGLAQLHQLRGRVGRGAGKSRCLLIYSPPLTETARQRLTVIKESEDGFVIAEKDLELRGAGDLLGTKQSGRPDFRLADLEHHADLLEIARDDAKRILSTDLELASPRGKALRTLLYLFERDAAVRYLRSG